MAITNTKCPKNRPCSVSIPVQLMNFINVSYIFCCSFSFHQFYPLSVCHFERILNWLLFYQSLFVASVTKFLVQTTEYNVYSVHINRANSESPNWMGKQLHQCDQTHGAEQFKNKHDKYMIIRIINKHLILCASVSRLFLMTIRQV